MKRVSGLSVSLIAASMLSSIYACGGDDSSGGDVESDSGSSDAQSIDTSVANESGPTDSAIVDAREASTPPLACDAGIACGGSCIAIDTANCGSCNYACFSGQTCGAEDAGTGEAGDAGDAGDAAPIESAITCVGPEPSAPRAIAPLSGSEMTNRKPTFSWIVPTGISATHAQVCSDRACTHVVVDLVGATADAGSQTTATPTADLPAGALFWRAFGNLGTHGTAPSPTWTIYIPQASAPHESSPRLTRDLNGDGLGDIVLSDDNTNVTFVSDAGTFIVSGSLGATFYGRSPTPSSTLTPVISTGEQQFVYAGDVDGDGFADLGDFGGTANSLYWGGITAPTPGGASGVQSNAYAGASGVGDVNGDGYDDYSEGENTGSDIMIMMGGKRAKQYMPPYTTFSNKRILTTTYTIRYGVYCRVRSLE